MCIRDRVVTGQLTNINFTNRIVTIIYPPTKREMECVYDDAVDELLIENRRGLIQVTGRVVLDDAGAPKKIIDVNDIRELDLSPLAVDTVKVGDLTVSYTHLDVYKRQLLVCGGLATLWQNAASLVTRAERSAT